MYRFFVKPEQIGETSIVITGGDVNHIKNVLRMKKGDTILVSDGSDREYVCTIDNFNNHQVIVNIQDVNGQARELPIQVTLFQALPKGDKMDTVIQKMVELGAYEIVPMSTKRCVVKLDAKKASAKTKRWNAIAENAAKQSKRGIIPQVNMPVTYEQALDMAKNMDMIIMPYEEADDMEKTRRIFSEITPGMRVGVLIGSEGGFTKEEVELAKNIKAREVTLGKRILRTETAGMAVMSVLMYLMEE